MGSIKTIMNSRNRITGVEVYRAVKEVRQKIEAPISNDTQNRDYVARTGVKYIKEGLSEEEALDKMMNDDIVKEFKYLKNNGLDIRNCFKNWIEAEIKKPRRKENRSRD